MTLDVRTIVLFATLMGLVLAAALYFISKGLPESVRGARAWSAGYLLQAGGALLVGLRSFYPDIVLIPLGNTLVVAGHIFQYAGIKQFLGAPYRRWPLVLLGVAVFAVCVYFTFPVDNFYVRSAATALGAIVVLVAGGRALFRAAEPRLAGARYAGLLLVGLAAMLAVRGVYTVFFGPPTASLFSGDPVQFVYVSAYVILGVMSGLAFVLLIAERLRVELERMATLDALTGIYNRRTFTGLAERELARAKRAGTPVGLILIDLDHFKTVNDRYGHVAGDAVLRAFVGTAGAALRKQDLLGRYGGEEFCVLLPGVSAAEAVMIAQRLRELVEQNPARVGDHEIRYTVSAGVAHSLTAGLDLDALVHDADGALYRAKERGRNQVSLAAGAAAGATGP